MSPSSSFQNQPSSPDEIRRFYDSIYHAEGAGHGATSPRHYDRLASRIGITQGSRVLDVACGNGEWLAACARRDAVVCGVDISAPAVERCHRRLPHGEFFIHAAETLPFSDGHFDVVSCLGALEHFTDAPGALREMCRVAKPTAQVVLLVPNADFLTRRLGLYSGTCQVQAKEEVYTLKQWEKMFSFAGLHVIAMWRDLHVLSRRWILGGRWFTVPLRFLQAALLPVWPMRWQYQVYFLCSVGKQA